MSGGLFAPFCWLVGLLLRATHAAAGLVLDPDSGASWLAATLGVLVLVRTSLLPLVVRTARSQVRLGRLGPQLEQARRDNVGNPNAVAAARVRIYREAGVNPLTPWIPLMVQVPVFGGLALVLHRAVNGGDAGFGLSAGLVRSLHDASIAGAPLSASLRTSSADVVALGGSPSASHTAVLVTVTVAVAITVVSSVLALHGVSGRRGVAMIYAGLMTFSVVAVATSAAVMPLLLAAYLAATSLWALVQSRWLRRVRARIAQAN